MAVSRAHWRPFIQALKDTGARPGEIAGATAADFKPDMGAFVFHKESNRRRGQFSHKTSKSKDRVIFLSGPTLTNVKELVEKYPTGSLFRRKNGKNFGKVNFVDRFMKLRRRLKMPHLTSYSYRHTFATEMLKAGMDVDTLAELMGNSAMVIRLHYSHLLADTKGLREKLERFKTAAAETQRPSPAA
jgi:integrase